MRPVAVMFAVLFTLMFVASSAANAAPLPRKEAMSDTDRQWMQVKKSEVDDLARRHLGTQLSGVKHRDLRLIQDLLDRGLVKSHETEVLQGMGYVLGDHLIREEGLRWTIYVDGLGRSRALEVPNKPDVVFPETAISRRHEVGAPVNVQSVYRKLQESAAYIKSRFYVNEMQ